MTRIAAATIAGTEHENQDAAGHVGSWFWVIDGATNPDGPSEIGAGDFAQGLSAALETVVQGSAGQDLRRVLAAAISASELAESGHSATVALGRTVRGGTEVLVLGDCTVIGLSSVRKRYQLSDTRLSGVAVPERSAWARAVTGGADPDDIRRLRVELVSAERARRNRPGGYWVAAAEPEAAWQGKSMTVPAGVPVALMTDGVPEVLERLGLDRLRALGWMNRIGEEGLESHLGFLRDWAHEATGAAVDDMTVLIAH